eukprot:c24104_g1_i1 orf=185-472(+)
MTLNSAGVATEVQNKGIAKPFQPLSIAFNSVEYYVDMPQKIKAQGVSEDQLQLVWDVSGVFRLGVLTDPSECQWCWKEYSNGRLSWKKDRWLYRG